MVEVISSPSASIHRLSSGPGYLLCGENQRQARKLCDSAAAYTRSISRRRKGTTLRSCPDASPAENGTLQDYRSKDRPADQFYAASCFSSLRSDSSKLFASCSVHFIRSITRLIASCWVTLDAIGDAYVFLWEWTFAAFIGEWYCAERFQRPGFYFCYEIRTSPFCVHLLRSGLSGSDPDSGNIKSASPAARTKIRKFRENSGMLSNTRSEAAARVILGDAGRKIEY